MNDWKHTHTYANRVKLMAVDAPGIGIIYYREDGVPYDKTIKSRYLDCVLTEHDTGKLSRRHVALVLAALTNGIGIAWDVDNSHATQVADGTVKLSRRGPDGHYSVIVQAPEFIPGFIVLSTTDYADAL